jgi:hypothetical protein
MSDGDAASPTATAVIVGADLAAGHDGQAELVLRIRYPNGVVGDVVLDAQTGFALMRHCDIESLDGLTGQSWRRILEGVEACTT